jgi:hypothetical protein
VKKVDKIKAVARTNTLRIGECFKIIFGMGDEDKELFHLAKETKCEWSVLSCEWLADDAIVETPLNNHREMNRTDSKDKRCL